MNKSKKTGNIGEVAVQQALQAHGFTIVQRNVHTRFGEIDIIAQKNGVTHIIEVKTRRSVYFGAAVEALTPAKFLKMKKAWYEVSQKQAVRAMRVQFDFAAVMLEGEKMEIEWFWNIGAQDFY